MLIIEGCHGNLVIVSIVSYRGGSGKSLFSLNFCRYLQNKVLLIDADFLAPSLHYLPDTIEHYWNDFLSGEISDIKNMIYQFHNIDVICTKPNDTLIIPKLMDKNLWSSLYSDNLNKFMSKYERDYDHIIIDNQSGTFYSTLLHCFFSNFLIVLIRPDNRDVSATANYLKLLKKPFYIVWNHVVKIEKITDHLDRWVEEHYKSMPGFLGELGRVPFDEDTAYQIWVKKLQFPEGTEYEKALKFIVEKYREEIRGLDT